MRPPFFTLCLDFGDISVAIGDIWTSTEDETESSDEEDDDNGNEDAEGNDDNNCLGQDVVGDEDDSI